MLNDQYRYEFNSAIHVQVLKRLFHTNFIPPKVPVDNRSLITFTSNKKVELPKRVLGAILETEKYLKGCDEEVAALIYDLHNYKHHFKKFAEIRSKIIYIPGEGLSQSDISVFTKAMEEARYQFGAAAQPIDSDHAIRITIAKAPERSRGVGVNFLRYTSSSINKINYRFESTSALENDFNSLESMRVLAQSLVAHLPRRFHRDFNSPFAFFSQYIDKYYSNFLEKKLKLLILILFMIYVTIHFSRIKESFLRKE